MTPAQQLARILDAADRTGELDWSLVREDFEIRDHELPDSSVHRGPEGWRDWVSDWQQAFEDYSIERVSQVELDEARVLTVHRLRARGRLSGVRLERTDAQLWTFGGDRLVRMDYYPDFREQEHSWSTPAVADVNRLCEAPPCGSSARLTGELCEVVLGECHEGARGR